MDFTALECNTVNLPDNYVRAKAVGNDERKIHLRRWLFYIVQTLLQTVWNPA
jgi:hypothetical protein